MKPPFDNFVFYIAFVLVAWISIFKLGHAVVTYTFDGLPASNKTLPDARPLRFLGMLVPLFWLFIAAAVAPDCAPAIVAVQLIQSWLCRREADEFDATGRAIRYRWVIRFGLLELLGSTLVIGATMGWYMRAA